MTNLRCVDATDVFRDYNGDVLAGGIVYVYSAFTFLPATAYSDASGSGAATSFTLNSYGRTSIYLSNAISYQLVLTDSNGAVLASTNNIQGNNTIITYSVGSGTIPLSALVTNSATRLLEYDNTGAAGTAVVGTNLSTSNDVLQYTQTIPSRGFVLLGRYTNSSNASYTLSSSLFTNRYSTYRIEIIDLSFTTSNVDFYVQTSSDGGATFDTTAGDYYQQAAAMAGGTAGASDSIGASGVNMYLSTLQSAYYLNYNMSTVPGGSALYMSNANATQLNYFCLDVHNPASLDYPTLFNTSFGSYWQHSTNKPVMVQYSTGGKANVTVDNALKLVSQSTWSGIIYVWGLQ